MAIQESNWDKRLHDDNLGTCSLNVAELLHFGALLQDFRKRILASVIHSAAQITRLGTKSDTKAA